jgi:hypothetical protein
MNMQPIISIKEEDEQASLIQHEVGMALRQSFEAVTSEPLPENIVLLLLRLVLAQSLWVRVGPEREADRKTDHRPLSQHGDG